MNAQLQPRAPAFIETLHGYGLHLERKETFTLQVNVGMRCNQACHHCHVEAGPKRSEMMDRRTAARVLYLLQASPGVQTLDLTGGAPELNPNFRDLVEGARSLGRAVIDRCNLTVLFEPGQEDTAKFLAEHKVNVVASLPCYSKVNVEKQRGQGVFEPSIRALRHLNDLGYGRIGSGLQLDLVYNPVGAALPPPQAVLEADYRRELGERFGLVFNRLFTITNMPIKRFLHALHRDGKLEDYRQTLLDAFNPASVAGLMCRDLVSVGYDGRLYDCDFNQMLEMSLGAGIRTIWDLDRLDTLKTKPISVANHCYGCTAGAGSSCGGVLV